MHKTLSQDFFFQHPMNGLMLEGGPLPQYDPTELAAKYIKLAQSGQMPTEDQVSAVKMKLVEFCRQVHGDDTEALQKDIDGIEATWKQKMHDRFARSLGLTQLMLDYGCKSRYFYQYLYITGEKMYGVALVAKDGYAVPVSAGTLEHPVLEKVPENDWMLVVCVEEPSHPARRGTDGAVQSLLRNAKSVFEAGAGLMSAYLNYEYPLGKLGQRIVACDSDVRLIPYLEILLDGHSPEEYGVEYHTADLMEMMAKPEYFGKFDVVRMTGLLSYFPDSEDKLKIMRMAQKLLNPTGVIVTDEWTMGPSLMRTALTGLWPIDPRDPHRLSPAESVDSAVAGMGKICKEIGEPYVYVGDICNGNLTCWTQARAVQKCVMFLVGRNATGDMFDLIPGATPPSIVQF